MRPVIILFAKAPVPGSVKTRLIPHLSPASAAALHTAFVYDLIDRFQALKEIADIELHTDVETAAWRGTNIHQALQGEGDLGLKMLQAMRLALSQGRLSAMIAGTDAPSIPLGHLVRLLSSSYDVALGPTEDGGFYAVNCRKISARMFDNVEWSTPQALKQTLAAAEASGLSVELGLEWWDVDTAADLDRLSATDRLPKHTAAFVRKTTTGEGNPMTNDATLKEGDIAPDIHVADDQGADFELGKLKGKNVVLYFYPKADTPGCTKESCEFRDSSNKFKAKDTVIVGVSPDKSAAQSKFRMKFDLPFTLLADVDHAAAEAYGVWKEKSLYGKNYMGIERTTFLIGKDGRIRRIFSKVKPEGHAEEVYQALAGM